MLPKLPTSSAEVHSALSVMSVKTIKEEDFILVNDEDQGIVIFSCTSNLKALSQTKTLLMEGTFEYAAKFFTQLFTIHGYSNNVYTPLVFCLLKDKKKETYAITLQLLRDRCEAIGMVLQPETIVVDFEVAIHGGYVRHFQTPALWAVDFISARHGKCNIILQEMKSPTFYDIFR